MKTPFMIASVVIWPPIQSMVVVTSPIGVQAPPALAAITIIPAKKSRSSCLSSSFFINEIITMVVVRLSRTELRKKVTKPTSHMSEESLVVLMREVMTSKPSWASTTSTMVMAPIRKKTICAVAGQRLAELLTHQLVVSAHDRVDGPEQPSPDQRRGGLVDPDRVLERDGCVGDDEDDDERGQHVFSRNGIGSRRTRRLGWRSSPKSLDA